MRAKTFLFRLAILNVLTKRFRAFLTIGGIALSSGVMVLLFGLGSGLQHMVTTQITDSALKNVVTVNTLNPKDVPLSEQSISKIQSITGVTDVQQIVNLSGEIVYNGISLFIPVYGVTDDYFAASPITTVRGDTTTSMEGEAHNIILSKGALDAFGIKGDPIDKKIRMQLSITGDNDSSLNDNSRELSSNDFVVKAIVDKGNAPLAYIPAEYLFTHKVDRASELKVQMDYPERLSSVRTGIERLGYQTSSVQDSIAQVNKIFNVIRSILVIFGIITILITVFGTINTITIQLIEETRQIGFLRVFGIKQDDVGFLFIVQSIFLSTSGALIGIIFGVLGGLITNGLIATATNGVAVSSQTPVYLYQIPAVPIIIILVLSVAIGWAIGILPARRAVTINPISALRL